MAAASTRRRRARRPIGANLVRIVALTLFLVFVLVPLYWMVMTSVKPTSDYMTIPPVWFPKEPTLVHYTAALFSYRGLQGLTNSLIVASAATVLSSLLGTMMAYSLARFNTAASISPSGSCRSGFCRRLRSSCRSSCCSAAGGSTTPMSGSSSSTPS